jgi:hypothetical protein
MGLRLNNGFMIACRNDCRPAGRISKPDDEKKSGLSARDFAGFETAGTDQDLFDSAADFGPHAL